MRSELLFIALLSTTPGALAGSSIWYVDVGAPCPGDGSLGSPYCTIQGALAAPSTVSGDEVVVFPGVYAESIDFLGKNVVLMSDAGPVATTIDASTLDPRDRVVTIENGEGPGCVLEGFTITGGLAPDEGSIGFVGGGIFCLASSPVIRGNIVTLNRGAEGAGIYCKDSDALIELNEISANGVGPPVALNGGGVMVRGGAPVVRENLITGNAVATNYGGAHGGGVAVSEGGSAFVEENTITNNAGYWGGGFSGGEGDWILRGNLVSGNEGVGGGGIEVTGSTGWVVENEVRDNEAVLSGGIQVTNAAPTILGNLIIENRGTGTHSNQNAGGVGFSSSSGLFAQNTVCDNSTAGMGGGIHLRTNALPTIVRNRIERNTAIHGGGIGVANSGLPPLFCGNVVKDNNATGDGGGWHVGDSRHVIAFNNTTAGNTAGLSGGGFHLGSSAESWEFAQELIWGNTAPADPNVFGGPAGLVFRYCDIQGGSGQPWFGEGCIDADPLLDSEGKLTSGSPCIDAGKPGRFGIGCAQQDCDGEPRFMGVRMDIGADEWLQLRARAPGHHAQLPF